MGALNFKAASTNGKTSSFQPAIYWPTMEVNLLYTLLNNSPIFFLS